jgi:uncharacterized protein YuzE
MVETLENDNIEIPQFHLDQVALSSCARSYDRQRDILYVYKTPKCPAISFDVGGHLWIRYAPETGEVVGLEIEDFEKVFLVKYPELKVGWDQLKPKITKPRPNGAATAEYLKLLMMFVKDILRTHPQQLNLPQT